MRSVSSTQQDVLNSASYYVYSRMRVANASGTLIDLSTYGGREWFAGGEMSVNVDEIVPSARLFVARSHSTAASGSLAPLIEGSTLNVNDAGSYAALLDPGAEVYWDVATLPQGSTQPATGSTQWLTLFHGEIDSVEFSQPEIEVYARDKIGALVADRWVESERVYGAETGVNIETVMQDISNDWADGQAVSTPSSPGFLVTAYQQTQQPVLEAHRTLAQLIGWDIRPEWSTASTGFAYMFREPDRSVSTTLWTFGSSQYFDVRRLDLSREDVRNVVSVNYTVSSTASSTSANTRATYTASDSTSISRFGRRWMEIDLADDSDIDTATEAQDLADACLSDLMVPDAEQEIETLFFWPVMLGDYYTYTANGVHYDVDQDWAVSGYRHILRNNEQRTYVSARGKPLGQYMNWHRRHERQRDPVDRTNAKSLIDFRDSQDSTANTVTFTWRRGDLVNEVWVYDELHSQPEPADPWPTDSDPPTSILSLGTDTYTATIPSANTMRTVQFEPRTATLESGPIRRARLYPRSLTEVTSTDITGEIIADQLIQSAQRFGSDIRFYSPDWDEVAWTSGTITFASSTQYDIGAGNTGNMGSTAIRYIYLDTGLSSTSLQVTTASTDTAGDGKTLLAVGQRAQGTGQTAFFVPAVGVLGLNNDHLSPNSIAVDTLQANSVTSVKIDVVSLSAISADLGTVTAGTLSANLIVAAQSFTASTAVFSGNVSVGQIGDLKTLTVFGSIGSIGGGYIETLTAGGDSHFLAHGTNETVNFYGANPTTRLDVSGSRGGNAALASLITALATGGLGLIRDQTTT